MNYLTKDGVPVKLSDRTCSTCHYLKASTRHLGKEFKTTYRCVLSGLKIRPEMHACVMYPKANKWIPDNRATSSLSKETQKDAS